MSDKIIKVDCLYSVSTKGTILIWTYARPWENHAQLDFGKIYTNQYGTEWIIRKRLPEGIFEDVSKFMDHLQGNFDKYRAMSRIVLRNKISKLENR